jgi:hypothetical protein
MTDKRTQTSALNGKRGASKQWKNGEPREKRISARITLNAYNLLTRDGRKIADAIEDLARAEK